MEHERTQEHRAIDPEVEPDDDQLYKELVAHEETQDKKSLRAYAMGALVTICLTLVAYHGMTEFGDAFEKRGVAKANSDGWAACVAHHSPKDCR